MTCPLVFQIKEALEAEKAQLQKRISALVNAAKEKGLRVANTPRPSVDGKGECYCACGDDDVRL